MTVPDHAAIVREQLRHLGPFRGGAGEAALDALVAERDEWKTRYWTHGDSLSEALAEVAWLREALLVIKRWDCLNPPDPKLCADHPWLKGHVDAALEGDKG